MVETPRFQRRSFLKGAGLVALGTAGCLGDRNKGEGSPSTADTMGTRTGTAPGTADDGDTTTPTGAPDDLSWAIDQGTVIDTFTDFEKHWSADDGTAKYSTRAAFSGDGSVLLDTTGVNRVRVIREFETSMDFRNHDLSLAVKPVDSSTGHIPVSIQLRGLFGGTHTVSGMVDTSVSGRWMRLDLGFHSADGGNLRAIKEILIYCWDGEDAFSKFYIDDLRILEKPEKGAVMFNFLGGAPGDYRVAYPTLEEFGWTGNLFPPSNGIDASEPPTPSQYRQMRDDDWVVGGHTVGTERLTDYSAGDQQIVFEENRRQLEERGLLGEHVPFVPPYDAYNVATLETVRDHFDSMYVRAGRAKTVSATVTDPRTIGTVDGEDLEGARASVDAAAEQRQLASLTIRMDEIDETQLKQLCQHVKSHVGAGRLEVLDAKQHFDRFATRGSK